MPYQIHKHLFGFKNFLEKKDIEVLIAKDEVICSHNEKKYSFFIANEQHEGIPLDLVVTQPEKLRAIIYSKLKMNKRVFARNCEVKKINKETAAEFLDKYHLMNSTQSAFNFGLVCNNELLALASFSKGRKMDRLPEDKRSFELIRFCCKEGITIPGGLTKLVKNFCKEKSAGDIMTYIDKQLSSGESFIKSGFVKLGETEGNYFLINKKTFERTSLKQITGDTESSSFQFDEAKFYLTQNSGNIKLVYTPDE